MQGIGVRQIDVEHYPQLYPYHPDMDYPEYPFWDFNNEPNRIYDTIRSLFLDLEYDIENYGSSKWNPLKDFVKPQNKVVIKPNWVNHFNPNEDNLDSLITHSSILRVILDYVIIALKGEGEIIIGDAPVQSCDFGQLIEKNHVQEIVDYLSKLTSVRIIVKDFRKEIMVCKNRTFERFINTKANYGKVNLGSKSFLHNISGDFHLFRVNNYDKNKMQLQHNSKDHYYFIVQDILDADTVIELPKLKTHNKAGITCCLKNNVGINALKDCLVHHRKGSISEGGDAYLKPWFFKRIQEKILEQYDRREQKLIRNILKTILKVNRIFMFPNFKDPYFEGSWYGNDTLWRMVLDLNKILYFADKESNISNIKQRKILYLVDGIIAGENEGPLKPNSINTGFLAMGDNPLKIDIILTNLIGFDYHKIPTLNKAVEFDLFEIGDCSGENFEVFLNSKKVPYSDLITMVMLQPSSGWKDHIEKPIS